MFKSFIGQGYHGTHTPGVILRNVLENPAWYTAYTPYQAEISQGRMEALVNFQTMVCDLTGMPIANASMLDEATAAAEAMTLARRSVKSKSNIFIVAGDCHPQTIEVIQTRARPLGIEVRVGSAPDLMKAAATTSACWRSTPSTSGAIHDLRPLVDAGARKAMRRSAWPPTCWRSRCWRRPANGMPTSCWARRSASACRWAPAARTPPTWPAATSSSARCPGRLVGVSIDTHGNPAYRLALQTREQHIRREKATSNICTAQVLPAVVASMYAVYHGPQGLKRIARASPATPPSSPRACRRWATRSPRPARSTRSPCKPAMRPT